MLYGLVLWHGKRINKTRWHAVGLRQDAVRALYSLQPCPALLQPASQLWKPWPDQPQSEQTLSPSQQGKAAKTLPQQTLTQPAFALEQALCSTHNPKLPVLPPLPESRVSILRQQARLCSLNLADIPEEEEEDCHMPDQDSGAYAGEEEGQKHIQIPVDLKVSPHAVHAL